MFYTQSCNLKWTNVWRSSCKTYKRLWWSRKDNFSNEIWEKNSETQNKKRMNLDENGSLEIFFSLTKWLVNQKVGLLRSFIILDEKNLQYIQTDPLEFFLTNHLYKKCKKKTFHFTTGKDKRFFKRNWVITIETRTRRM